ncbi:diguanylate cyclase domain-containing protein [Duganella sp. BK701]|uniref:diguanylate cyclase domain-containing protein n=1 Tax=Duganella sp. BK701 TaxID=2512166 RepID=UPI001E4E7689|nr:diguanylate cyclase [Duganella sp. BK701]
MVLLVLSATLIVTLMALLLAERDMRSVIGNQQFSLLTSIAAQVDAQMESRKVLLASLADTIPQAAAQDPAAMQAFIDRHPVARRQFLNLHIFNRQGVLLHTDGDHTSVTRHMPPPARDFLDRAMAAGKPVVSLPYKSEITGLPSIMILHPVRDAQGQVAMLLGGSIDLSNSNFLEQIAQQKPGETGYLFIMTRAGILVHHPDRKRLLAHINARPGYNRATEMALDGFQGWVEAANKDGSDGIYSYKHLASTGWIIGARFPVDEAFAPMIAMRQHAMLAAAAFAAVAGLVAWLAIRSLLAPLGRLQRHIANIRSGSADISVLQRRRGDEIGELGAAFHDLMAEREAAQSAIRDSESLISNILERAPDAFVSCENTGVVTKWNAAAERVFGWSSEEAIGRDIAELIIPPAQRAAHRAGMARFADGIPGPFVNNRVRVTALHRDGHEIPVELSIGALRHDGAYYATAFLHDVTERVQYEQQIAASEARFKQLARIDTLTGIANRLVFEEVLQQAILRARRNRKALALAYLDIDYFKEINDTLGHGAGDIVLKEFASRLVASVRASDTVARLAGDEFVIVFEQVANADEAARLAAKIVTAVRSPFPLEDAPRKVTTSMGVALHEGDDETCAELIARADSALYAAKRNGRDGFVVGD